LAVPQISQILQDKGFISSPPNQGSLSVIYSQLIKQATMMSFNDAFYLLSVMMMLILPLILLMKKGKEDVSGAGMD
jgi:DHA2 family multidrug resistance protein